MTTEFEQMWACPVCGPALPIPASQDCSGCGMTFAELVERWPKTCPDEANHVGTHSDCAGDWARIVGDCGARPCAGGLAIVSGCTCGLYLCSIRRRLGHHDINCGIFKKGKADE